MTWIYDAAYGLLLLIGWPWLVWRRWRRGVGSVALGERLGAVPTRAGDGACVWLHGVSVGEINAARTVVAELQRRRPDLAIVISSTTTTGFARAQALYGDALTVFRFPIDFSFAWRRVLDRLDPQVVVLLELEIWPNLAEVLRQRGVPLLIANGRVTEVGTMKHFRKPVLRSIARRMFRTVAWVGASAEEHVPRFAELGVAKERVESVGSLKYDTAELADGTAGQRELATALGIDATQPLWVCGSTGPGEEELLLDAYGLLLEKHPGVQLALVPRKPERFDEVAGLITSRGFAVVRRSKHPDGAVGAPLARSGDATSGSETLIFLGDTLGELRKFYALASVVFVGRTLVPMGGSDMMEVAALSKPMVSGRFVENFREVADLLSGAGALVRVERSPEAILDGVVGWLDSATRSEELGRAGRTIIEQRRGATERTVHAIERFLAVSGAG